MTPGRRVATTTAPSDDGTEVQAIDEGAGRVVLLVGPGMDVRGQQNEKLAKVLATRFRVLRLLRRQYRVDLKTDIGLGTPRATAQQEVDDVLAMARAVDGPVLLYGHSSGAVIALEALVASPESFAGAVLFEPAAIVDEGEPLSGPDHRYLEEARAALAAGKPGRAMSIFLAGPIRMKPWVATVAGRATALVPSMRKVIPCQINDLETMDEIGCRLDAYARIEVPVVMLGGDITDVETVTSPTKNPAHIGRRLDAITKALPNVEQVIMQGQSHMANNRAPKKVAAVIEELADKVMP